MAEQRKTSSRRLRAIGRGDSGAGGKVAKEKAGADGDGTPAVLAERRPVDGVSRTAAADPVPRADLNPFEQRLLGDLFAIVEEHADQAALPIDRDRVQEAFAYACVHHADQ